MGWGKWGKVREKFYIFFTLFHLIQISNGFQPQIRIKIKTDILKILFFSLNSVYSKINEAWLVLHISSYSIWRIAGRSISNERSVRYVCDFKEL